MEPFSALWSVSYFRYEDSARSVEGPDDRGFFEFTIPSFFSRISRERSSLTCRLPEASLVRSNVSKGGLALRKPNTHNYKKEIQPFYQLFRRFPYKVSKKTNLIRRPQAHANFMIVKGFRSSVNIVA